MVIAVVVSLAAAGLVVLIVMVVSLARQTVRLAGAIREYERATQPVLEEIRNATRHAESQLHGISKRRPPRGAEKAGRR
jgi:predicted PurR-regulated permease PerM